MDIVERSSSAANFGVSLFIPTPIEHQTISHLEQPPLTSHNEHEEILNKICHNPSKMLVSLTVGKVDAGVAVLLTEDKRLVSFHFVLNAPGRSITVLFALWRCYSTSDVSWC